MNPVGAPSRKALKDKYLQETTMTTTRHPQAGITLLAFCILLCAQSLHADILLPPGPGPEWLDWWSFDNTNTWVTERGYLPATFTNIGTCELGDYWTAILDDTNEPAWLNYNITEANGTNHFRVDKGSIMFWFAPNWSGTNEGGSGPGEWSRLIEVGAYTTNASYGWWSLYTDPEGVNLYFSAQTNDGSGATYLSAPIDWNITNRWHLITLTYSQTNSTLWIDAVPITNGPPVTYWPGPDVLTNGFFIGSDSSGFSQAHGMFDDLFTYDHEISGKTITNEFWYGGIWYYANPDNSANFIASAPSSPTLTPYFNAVTGPGNLIQLSNAVPCLTNSRVWLTNFTATMASNRTMNVTFTIAGGAQGALYDVFANSVLDFSTNRAVAWAWMGQGQHCMTYMLTNLTNSGAFLVLGTPEDDDGDGLTTAYEWLVSKTNPLLWDTDGDGKSDGVEVATGTDPLHYDQRSSLELAAVGGNYMRIIAPDLLELVRVTSETNTWNWFPTNSSPSTNDFRVNTPSGSVNVMQVGFKRHPLYAPFEQTDLRIEDTLYLRLASTNWAASNATVEVTTTNTALWPSTMRFVAVNNPLRYGPTIHVNQAGYSPNTQKKAMIGYYLGNLSEMQISTNLGFKIVDATGAQVYPTSGLATLTNRADNFDSWGTIGTTPVPQYQQVLEADFTAFTNSGQFQLVVPGLGASYSFRVDQGTMMSLARTYALGLYHQRCGNRADGKDVNTMPFTRFSHGNCHTNPASIPLPMSAYSFTWDTLAGYGNEVVTAYTNTTENPPQIAPALTDTNSMLFKFPTNLAPIDVSGGHHDAGDYSKYTINSAHLIHILTFATDNLGLDGTNFDNFGIPESTNGTPDILDELRIEADFLVKMQDTTDGGFYFLVYPVDTEYENRDLPQYGHPQVVWPKTTSVTAAAVGALAEVGSSKAFGSYFPSLTNSYMRAATNGWKFLTNAIAKYGHDGCYQKITSYGDDFTHDDELAWAAAALYAATGNSVYSNKLYKWFPHPTDGRNGYRFARYNATNSIPTTGNTNVYVAYLPDTVNTNNTANKMYFTIFDAEGQKVVTNKIETAIPHYSQIPTITNRLNELKLYFNTHTGSVDTNYVLNTISSLVGFCHGTWADGWRRMSEGYGCACRDYAFAARSGRRSTNDLNSAYLAECLSEITNRAADLRLWSSQNAYGTSFDPYSKNGYVAGWYFAGNQTFDLAVATRIETDVNALTASTNAILENLNYEAGRNPINVSRLTGLGSYRQRAIVHQYAWNNASAILPPSGIPLGNLASGFPWNAQYQFLTDYCFPGFFTGSNSFALYDRWAETWNVSTEFVHLNTARALVSAMYLVTSPTLRTQAWQSGTATIVFPNGLPSLNGQRVAQISTTQDLSQAQILWDPGRVPWNFYGQQPVFGTNFTFIATNIGDPPLQAEILFPDGRRLFAVTNLQIWATNGGAAFTNDGNTVALYHFDTSDLTHMGDDSSGHGYNLIRHGLATTNQNANWMAAPSGAVARFGGVDDYLEFTGIPYTNILASTNSSLTMEARIFPRAYKTDANNNGQEIVTLYQNFYSSTQAAQWSLYYAPLLIPDAPQVYASGYAVIDNTTWSQIVTPYTWHSLKITFQPSGVTTACIDGAVLCRSTNAPPYYGWQDGWRVTLGHFDGDIDEVRISNNVRP